MSCFGGVKEEAYMRFLAAVVLLLSVSTFGLAQPRLLSLSDAQRDKLPKEAIEHIKQAEKLFAKAVYHLHMAEELAPGLAEGQKPKIVGNKRIDPHMMRRSARTRSSSRYSRTKKSSKSSSSSRAEEERRKLDKNYDRGKKGSKVLSWGLKVLSKIPVVKKFVPKGAAAAADAAGKVGNKITAPKDGMANINGKLKVWNSKTNSWEDF